MAQGPSPRGVTFFIVRQVAGGQSRVARSVRLHALPSDAQEDLSAGAGVLGSVVVLKVDPAVRRRVEDDQFASDFLIPPHHYLRFVASGRFSQAHVEAFASEVGIDPGVVVGRLQHDGHLNHDERNSLRARFIWASEAETTS
jgi:hypothetical protein